MKHSALHGAGHYLFNELLEGTTMAIRPFYMEANIDGRASKLSGGPKSKSGGMDINIYQRDKGSIVTMFKISTGGFMRDGKLYLVTKVLDRDNRVIATEETEY